MGEGQVGFLSVFKKNKGLTAPCLSFIGRHLVSSVFARDPSGARKRTRLFGRIGPAPSDLGLNFPESFVSSDPG